MSKRFVWLAALAAIPTLALAGSGIVPQAQAAPALVKTAAAQILVNAQGMTLYIFTPDKHNKSVCTGQCAHYWPPATVSKGTKVAAILPGVSGTFGVTMRADEKQQLTYDGAPLYTFIEDKKPGDMTGQGSQGGTWWVVVVPGSAGQGSHTDGTSGNTPAPTPTVKSGYGGYYSGHGGGHDG